jgi:hypothetical protein
VPVFLRVSQLESRAGGFPDLKARRPLPYRHGLPLLSVSHGGWALIFAGQGPICFKLFTSPLFQRAEVSQVLPPEKQCTID